MIAFMGGSNSGGSNISDGPYSKETPWTLLEIAFPVGIKFRTSPEILMKTDGILETSLYVSDLPMRSYEETFGFRVISEPR
jgi:hypothetical protein